jgi:uncharacterized protein
VRDYIYILQLTPKFRSKESWTEKENAIIEQHDQRLAKQKERGVVKFVGKTDLPIENVANMGIVVFQAENDTMAELFMRSDAAVMKGIMTAECHPFTQVY